jgi:hypothetical protein
MTTTLPPPAARDAGPPDPSADARPAGTVPDMADGDDPPARTTAAQRAQEKRDQKLADVQKEIDSGRMTRRQLTPEEMAEHAERREEVQAERRKRKS